MSQPKYGQIINCGLTILIVSLFSQCRLRNTTQLRSGTVDKSKWPVFLQNASGNPTYKAILLWVKRNGKFVFVSEQCVADCWIG